MNLTENFTVAEFTDSDTARRRGIDNRLPATLLVEAKNTCELLERIRAHLSQLRGRQVPVIVTSGFRCLALNRAIGSGDSSDHVQGRAADIKAPAFGTPYEVCKALEAHVDELGIGQLIHEFGSWVHVSTRQPTKAHNRILTISRRGAEIGIREVVA